jgi:hypothetical protein
MTPLPRLGHPHDGQDPPLMLSEYSPTAGQAARQPLALPTLLAARHKIRPGILAERGQFENPS